MSASEEKSGSNVQSVSEETSGSAQKSVSTQQSVSDSSTTQDTQWRGSYPITTMPKCQLDTKPDFEFSSLPVYVAPVYVDPTSYEFIIPKKNRVDRTLDVYFIGVNDPITNRPWAFTLGTPKCSLHLARLSSLGMNPTAEHLFVPHMQMDRTPIPNLSYNSFITWTV